MAQRGGVVDHDDVARERQRGEVGRAQQRPARGRARSGSTSCSHAWPARCDEPRRRRGGPRRRRAAARAAGRRARAPSARRRRARGARRRGRRWRCGDRAAGVRVGVDGRSLVGGGARGVAHYTAALLEALASAYPDDEYRVLLPAGRGDGAGGTVAPSATRCPRGCCSAPRRWRAAPGSTRCWAAATSCGRPRRRRSRSARPRSCSPSTTARGRSARRTSRATSGSGTRRRGRGGSRGARRACCATPRSCATS